MNELILHPTAARDREELVRDGFWDKVRKTAGKLPFVEDAVAAYFCAKDPKAPASVKAAILGALAYFVLPVDFVPDFIVGLGYNDDAAVLYGVLKLVHTNISHAHKVLAAGVLGTEPPAPPAV